jgi:hypothetical protein
VNTRTDSTDAAFAEPPRPAGATVIEPGAVLTSAIHTVTDEPAEVEPRDVDHIFVNVKPPVFVSEVGCSLL